MYQQLVFCYIYQKFKYCLLCGCVLPSKATFNDKLREDCKNTAGGQHKRYNYCNLIAASQYETKVQILRLIYKTVNNNEIQYLHVHVLTFNLKSQFTETEKVCIIAAKISDFHKGGWLWLQAIATLFIFHCFL